MPRKMCDVKAIIQNLTACNKAAYHFEFKYEKIQRFLLMKNCQKNIPYGTVHF